ncbi:unnamed protein product [Symbiodinium sp. CCMP2592]|nr:unnamed protein product [Symbiodinium sp. CCMP2592]
MATLADDKAETACAIRDSLELDDRAKAREQLEDAAAGNILLELMTAAQNNAELVDSLAAELPGKLIAIATPLIMFFLIFAIYILICCWTACPCCKCCRCCRGKRNIPFIVKLVFLLVIGGVVLALVILSSLSTRGYSRAVEGFDVTNCAAARMVNATFQGQSDPYFLGLIPVLNIFDELEGSLAENSQFINDLRGILLDTQDITDSVTVATATLDMLSAMLSDSRNTLPTNTFHECAACGPLASTLSDVSSAVSSGTAAALSAARVEVDNQLSGSSLVSLRSSLSTATAPLVELKTTIKSSFTPFVEDTLMETLSDQMNANGFQGLALAIAACAIIAVLVWMCCDKRRSDDSGEPVSSPWTYRCACCTWCCGCYYTMLAFFLGGILLILAVPLSSMCLIMEDINSQMITDISGALEIEIAGPTGDMMGAMIDQCIQNSTANPRLLDLITIEENGNQVTMYNKLVVQTQAQITTQFDQLGSAPSSNLASSTEVTKLTQMLRDVPLDAMMYPVQSIGSNPDYQPMGGNSNLLPYFASSASCTSFTIPTGYSLPQEGTTTDGIFDFVTAVSLEGYGGVLDYSPATCAKQVVCTASEQQGALQVCAATARFMQLKQDLRSQNRFTCRRFRQSGSVCDVINMAQSGSTWINDCLGATVEEYGCSLADFVTLVQDYDQRLTNVFNRLDTATTQSFTKIQTNLKTLLDQYFLSKITTIGNGVTCGFMGETYKGVIDGMCYGGVWGVQAVSSSYAACAVVTLLLVIIMYILWRLSLDNVAADQKLHGEDAVVPIVFDPVAPRAWSLAVFRTAQGTGKDHGCLAKRRGNACGLRRRYGSDLARFW